MPNVHHCVAKNPPCRIKHTSKAKMARMSEAQVADYESASEPRGPSGPDEMRLPHKEWIIISLFSGSDRFLKAGVLVQASRCVTRRHMCQKAWLSNNATLAVARRDGQVPNRYNAKRRHLVGFDFNCGCSISLFFQIRKQPSHGGWHQWVGPLPASVIRSRTCSSCNCAIAHLAYPALASLLYEDSVPQGTM